MVTQKKRLNIKKFHLVLGWTKPYKILYLINIQYSIIHCLNCSLGDSIKKNCEQMYKRLSSNNNLYSTKVGSIAYHHIRQRHLYSPKHNFQIIGSCMVNLAVSIK